MIVTTKKMPKNYNIIFGEKKKNETMDYQVNKKYKVMELYNFFRKII